MKTDRLIGIVMYLLNKDIVSATILAKRFEVSKRTIQRDMDTLSQAGIPIVSTFGSEGGYGIIDGFQLTKQIANMDDYMNIITGLKGLCSAYDNNKTNKTLEKALATMQTGEQKVFIDFSSAGENIVSNQYLKDLEQAIINKTLMSLTYSNAQGHISERTVEPLALSYRWYSWYLFAFCIEKQDYRIFKLPRIISFVPIKGSFSKDHRGIEEQMELCFASDKRTYYFIRLHCSGKSRQQILEYLRGTIEEELENGDFIYSMHVPLERMWFSLLLGFGNEIKVLEPEYIKDLIHQKAAEIINVYQDI